jgi:lipopolysaccharide/colanic/teichoic acid biosynthesis glycosyltransferase
MNSTVINKLEKDSILPIRNKSILYVGNNNNLLLKLNYIYSVEYNIVFQENAIIAINALKTGSLNPEIIIADANNASMFSMDFFLTVKKIESVNPIFILVTDKILNSRFVQRAYDLNIDDIFHFPFNNEQFSKRIEFHLNNKNAKQVNEPKKQVETDKVKSDYAKRLFDIVFSSLALLMLSPILIVFAILIKLDSKGPVFFISKRVGRGYKIFDFYKFRSMKTGAENMIDSLKDKNQYKVEESKASVVAECKECLRLGTNCSPILVIDEKTVCENLHFNNLKSKSTSFLKFKNDPRVTKLGMFLRKSSIDELPQLLNILKGDMSFVGNRPLPLYEAEQLTSDNWSQRFNAPAGLTGLWQVSKRGKANMSEDERKELDNTYAKNHSFLGDMILILKTLPALTQKESV